MKVSGCVFIDKGTVEEVKEFLSKFPDVCKVYANNGNIAVEINYTVG